MSRPRRKHCVSTESLLMTPSDLVEFGARIVAITYTDGLVVRGRLHRTGAETFELNPYVKTTKDEWASQTVDVSKIEKVVEEPVIFYDASLQRE